MRKNRVILSAFLFLLFAILVLCLAAFFTSPYRFLRPYSLRSAEKLISTSDHRLSEHGSHWQIRIHQDAHSFIPDFYIDQIPITVADYKSCVSEGKCSQPHYHDEYDKYYAEAIYADTPVTFVTWGEAMDYCKAYGGRLPTVLQWEITAGLFERNTYPWGNDEPNITMANYDGFYQGLTPAGWIPGGATRDGVLDMGGNVREWVAGLYFPENEGKYDNDFRQAEVVVNEMYKPENLEIERILKGGGANDYPDTLKIKNYQVHAPNSPGFNRGFRCVYEIPQDSVE